MEEIDIEVQVVTEEEIKDLKIWSLVVFNDDVNTFEHVIDTLVSVCKHEPHQAEQCAWIIHFKGKCSVDSGDWEDLAAKRNAIVQRGISAEVVLK